MAELVQPERDEQRDQGHEQQQVSGSDLHSAVVRDDDDGPDEGEERHDDGAAGDRAERTSGRQRGAHERDRGPRERDVLEPEIAQPSRQTDALRDPRRRVLRALEDLDRMDTEPLSVRGAIEYEVHGEDGGERDARHRDHAPRLDDS